MTPTTAGLHHKDPQASPPPYPTRSARIGRTRNVRRTRRRRRRRQAQRRACPSLFRSGRECAQVSHAGTRAGLGPDSGRTGRTRTPCAGCGEGNPADTAAGPADAADALPSAAGAYPGRGRSGNPSGRNPMRARRGALPQSMASPRPARTYIGLE